MLENYFLKLGFNQTEAKVYLSLAEIGKSTASLLAKKINIPRTTVYSVLNKLQHKGLVALEKKRNTTFYTSNNPQAILRNLLEEKNNLNYKESLAKELIQLATPYFKSQFFSIPKIQFYEGKKNVESMLYQNTEMWHQSMENFDNTYWGYQDHTFVEQYMEWLEWSWKIKKEDVKIKLISNRAKVEKSLKVKGRTILPVAKDLDFSSSIWICGDYIILIMSRQTPHYAFQLKDAVFAANLRSLFQMLWQFLSK